MQPISKNLVQFVRLCDTNDDYRHKLAELSIVAKSKEWKFVIELLWSMKNEMAKELLQSNKYTKETPENKDITQVVYHNISEWIDFLTQPRAWVAKKTRLRLITDTVKGVKPERKEQKHG